MKTISILMLFTIILVQCEKQNIHETPYAIEVSSSLSEGKRTFGKEQLQDNARYSWCEGAKGPGLGEFISISSPGGASISKIYIINGFGEPGFYKANNRVKSFSLISDSGEKVTFSLSDRNEPQEITIPGMEGESFKLQIESVYKGTKYDDTCITELRFKPISSDFDKDAIESEKLKNEIASLKAKYFQPIVGEELRKILSESEFVFRFSGGEPPPFSWTHLSH